MGWKPLKIGNGGILCHVDIAPDGTRVCATDSFSAYVWNPSKDQWVQLLTIPTMPNTIKPFNGNGVDDIRIDPQNSNNIWMQWGGNVYRSNDKANTFAELKNQRANVLLTVGIKL